ncbi:MAG: hypothetical protein V7L23_13245 [Nostoc sp.]|uniref:hypothetical protein n=1 Tax=Nostoc sp. TaxID=1180 RepID=UPI002FF2B3D0
MWNNAKTDKSYRKTHSRLKYRRSQVEALVIAKGFRLKKTRSRIWELVKVETGEVKSFELLELVVKYLEQVNVKQ